MKSKRVYELIKLVINAKTRRELRFLEGAIEERKLAEREFCDFLKEWYSICCYKTSFKDDWIEEKIKELEDKE